MASMEELNPALLLAGECDAPAARPFDLAAHYPEEMARPEVARLVELFAGLDRYEVHGKGKPQAEDYRFTYGETPPPVLYRMLRRWGVGPQDVFYDLGSGCGVAVLTAALLAGKAVGVELVPEAVEFARRVAGLLEVPNVEFRQGDLLETDLTEATFVYAACTLFPKPLRAQLEARLRTCRKGTRVLTATHPIRAKGFLLVARVPMFFSWAEQGEGYSFEFYYHVRQ